MPQKKFCGIFLFCLGNGLITRVFLDKCFGLVTAELFCLVEVSYSLCFFILVYLS